MTEWPDTNTRMWSKMGSKEGPGLNLCVDNPIHASPFTRADMQCTTEWFRGNKHPQGTRRRTRPCRVITAQALHLTLRFQLARSRREKNNKDVGAATQRMNGASIAWIDRAIEKSELVGTSLCRYLFVTPFLLRPSAHGPDGKGRKFRRKIRNARGKSKANRPLYFPDEGCQEPSKLKHSPSSRNAAGDGHSQEEEEKVKAEMRPLPHAGLELVLRKAHKTSLLR